MSEEKEEYLRLEELSKIDELQSKMRNINTENYNEILEISMNIFSKSNTLIYSYFNSLKSMAKSRKDCLELYNNLGMSLLESCDFLTNDEKQDYQLNIQSKSDKKVMIKSTTEEIHPIFEKIAETIQKDDIDQFQHILSQTNLNPNSEITVIDTTSVTDQKKNSKNNDKETSYTLIECAALNSSIKIFKFLLLNLGKNPKLNEKLYNSAINGGNFDIIHLIEKEHPQLIKQTSLHKSISLHQNQIALYLLENYEFIRLDNESAKKCVKVFNIEYLLKYLNDIKGNETKELISPLFIEAIETRQLGLTEFFLSNYSNLIDINQPFYSKRLRRFLRPLIYSIKMKFTEVSLFLISRKSIKFQFFDEEGEPDAINEAIKVKNYQIIELLLKKPTIDINKLDFNYYAPIHYSIFVKDFRIFSMIIQNEKSDISLRGGSNETVYHYAALNSFIEIFEYALKNYPEKFELRAKNVYGIFY